MAGAQVVGVRGRNPTGECLVAAQLVTALPRAPPRSPVADLERFARATGKLHLYTPPAVTTRV